MDDAARYDFTLRQGSDFTSALSWSTNDGDDPATPWDFTGATVALQARTSPDDSAAALSLVSGDGLIAEGNTITISLTGEQLANVEARRYGYDLKVTYPDGTQSVLLTGALTIEAEYTRA